MGVLLKEQTCTILKPGLNQSCFFQVGSHLMSATLRQLGFKMEFVYGNLDWALAEARLNSGVRIAFALRYLKHAKIGLVGYQVTIKNFCFAQKIFFLGI